MADTATTAPPADTTPVVPVSPFADAGLELIVRWELGIKKPKPWCSMVLHDDARRLRHMLEHTLEAIASAEERSQVELKQDRLLQLALTRLIEIIGEATARVSSSAQARCPGIPWPPIISMRNRLIHGYDSVDLVFSGRR